jgi:GNAT superfamily N-acetyltransferase
MIFRIFATMLTSTGPFILNQSSRHHENHKAPKQVVVLQKHLPLFANYFLRTNSCHPRVTLFSRLCSGRFMSLFTKIKKAKAQGYYRTFELLFCRFVPPWIFRYSKGDIYDFDFEKLKSVADSLSSEASNSLVTKCLEGTTGSKQPDDDERMRLRDFTYSCVPLESTANDLAYAIYDANDPSKLLGGVWIALDSFSEDNLGLEFQFGKNQAWLYCAFVAPSARGRGVYKKLVSFVASDLEQRGYSQLLAIIQPWNRISRMMHQKPSQGIIGTLSSIRVFGWAWISHRGNLKVDKRLATNVKARPANIAIGKLSYPSIANTSGKAAFNHSSRVSPTTSKHPAT